MNLMATTILSVFKNRTLAMYRDADVIRDLMRLSIVERPSGFKLTATRDKMGHADRAIAIAIGLPWAAILANDLKFYEQHRNHSDVGERILAV
jgi:phage FluMu gp28-like protein